MSEPTSERQTGINTHGGEQVGFAEAKLRAPGSRNMQAGGELRRRTLPSVPGRTSKGFAIGRILWRLSIALLCMISHLLLASASKKVVADLESFSLKLENLLGEGGGPAQPG